MIEINQELLKNPTPRFRLFEPSQEKVQKIAATLMENYLYISDEFRQWDVVYGIINRYFMGQGLNLIYEIDDFKGAVGFCDIIPGWRSFVMLKMWGIDDDHDNWKEIFNKDLVRQGRKLVEIIAQEFNIKRFATETADPKIVKIAKMYGFLEEGTQPLAFSWKGKFMDNIQLSRIFREED